MEKNWGDTPSAILICTRKEFLREKLDILAPVGVFSDVTGYNG